MPYSCILEYGFPTNRPSQKVHFSLLFRTRRTFIITLQAKPLQTRPLVLQTSLNPTTTTTPPSTSRLASTITPPQILNRPHPPNFDTLSFHHSRRRRPPRPNSVLIIRHPTSEQIRMCPPCSRLVPIQINRFRRSLSRRMFRCWRGTKSRHHHLRARWSLLSVVRA